MTALQVRAMKADDLNDVMEVEEKSFASPWSKATFEAEITNNDLASYLVVEESGRVVGYGGMWIIVDEAHVTNIAIHPDYRGRGWSNLLLNRMITTAKKLGAVKMTLEVRVNNHIAQKLYNKFGFKASGLRPKYYTDNDEDAVIMWLEL